MKSYSHQPFRNHVKEIAYKPRCNCGTDTTLPCCRKAASWIKKVYDLRGSHFNHSDSKHIYENLVIAPMKECKKNLEQIERDLHRTFPLCPYFGKTAVKEMRSVLTAFSKYDPATGYVQGMNFVVGSLLHHASEEIAFWLFVALVEDYGMREVYLPGLPGLYTQAKKAQELISAELPSVSAALATLEVTTDMFITNWIFTLFSSFIPINSMGSFYDKFFSNSWEAFHKLLLHILKLHENNILKARDTTEVLTLIKRSKPKEQWSKVPLLNKITIEANWDTIILNSMS